MTPTVTMSLKEYDSLKQIGEQVAEALKKGEMVISVYIFGAGDYLYRIENPTTAVKTLQKNLEYARREIETLKSENERLKSKKRKWFWQ